MPKAKLFVISVENRPGTLAHVAKVLGDNRVNILGFLTTTSNGEGTVQVIVDNVNKAKKALESSELKWSETDVLQVELPNVSGTLARFSEKLAPKGINVTCGFATAARGAKKASVVLVVSDLEGASRVR
jgi:hypothetical protein